MKDKIQELYEAKLDNIRYELIAYDKDSMEAIDSAIDDYDLDTVIGQVRNLQKRIEDKMLQEATEEAYDVEPAEY